MRLEEIYSKNRETPAISFEIYPPKKETVLPKELSEIVALKPDLISVTYGAGGANRDKSLTLVETLQKKFSINVLPHFTCVCSSKEYIQNYLKEITKLKIENILALRGDEPQDITVCYRDFKYASDLIKFIKSNTTLDIAVAGYPEGHKQNCNLKKEIEYLKMKTDLGAKVIYTQLFFDNDVFFRFKDNVKTAGINIPIIPGILPIISYNQLERMTSLCSTSIPNALKSKLQKYANNDIAITEIGIEFASKQSQDLIISGVKGLHFYTLNKAYSVKNVLENIL